MTSVIPWNKDCCDIITSELFKNVFLMQNNLSNACKRDLKTYYAWVDEVGLDDFVDISINVEIKVANDKRVVKESVKDHIRIGELFQESFEDLKRTNSR